MVAAVAEVAVEAVAEGSLVPTQHPWVVAVAGRWFTHPGTLVSFGGSTDAFEVLQAGYPLDLLDASDSLSYFGRDASSGYVIPACMSGQSGLHVLEFPFLFFCMVLKTFLF